MKQMIESAFSFEMSKQNDDLYKEEKRCLIGKN